MRPLDKVLLLDIDGVLIEWHRGKSANMYGKHGFTDWHRPKAKHFGWVARDQISLVSERFAGRIMWHTTWALEGATDFFEQRVGMAHAPTLIDEVGLRDAYSSISDRSRGWWKWDAVEKALNAGLITGATQVLWVDDDHVGFPWVHDKLTEIGMERNFRNVSPTEFWTRTAIESNAQWLNNSKLGEA